MHLVLDNSRYEMPKGPRFVLAAEPEAGDGQVRALRTYVPGSVEV